MVRNSGLNQPAAAKSNQLRIGSPMQPFTRPNVLEVSSNKRNSLANTRELCGISVSNPRNSAAGMYCNPYLREPPTMFDPSFPPPPPYVQQEQHQLTFTTTTTSRMQTYHPHQQHPQSGMYPSLPSRDSNAALPPHMDGHVTLRYKMMDPPKQGFKVVQQDSDIGGMIATHV